MLFEPGDAYKATRTFIDVLRPKLNGTRAMLRARQRVLRLSRSELMDITEDWVEAAFSIDPKDRAYMERLVVRRTGAAPPGRRPAWKPPCIERPRGGRVQAPGRPGARAQAIRCSRRRRASHSVNSAAGMGLAYR